MVLWVIQYKRVCNKPKIVLISRLHPTKPCLQVELEFNTSSSISCRSIECLSVKSEERRLC